MFARSTSEHKTARARLPLLFRFLFVNGGSEQRTVVDRNRLQLQEMVVSLLHTPHSILYRLLGDFLLGSSGGGGRREIGAARTNKVIVTFSCFAREFRLNRIDLNGYI